MTRDQPSATAGGPATEMIQQRAVSRIADEAVEATDDALAVEAPLEFRVDGHPGAVTMRTPGHDEELIRGFLFAEGVIGAARDIRHFEALAGDRADADADAGDSSGSRPLRGTVVNAVLRSPLVRARLPERGTFASSSCGVCGKVSIASLAVRAPKVDSGMTVARQIIAGLPSALGRAQEVFRATGGLHATGLFTSGGELLCAREDVGRHNAMDKVIGWALAAGKVPLDQLVLCVSGRLSFELVQKAVVAGAPVVVAVSAPSSLAVEVAEHFGVTLCGFVRGASFNVYTRPNRVV